MRKPVVLLSLFFLFHSAIGFAQNTTVKNDSFPLPGKRLFKIDFIAPITGNFTIGYEQAVSKNVSLDFEVGIIGAGKNPEVGTYDNVFGLFLKVGPCLYFTPNYESPKNKGASRFQGTYLKPTISVSSFSYNGYSYIYTTGGYISGTGRINNTTGALLLNLGHQFVFDRILSFNFYGGVGYMASFSNQEYNSDGGYEYGYAGGDSGFPFAVDGGIEIGLISKR